MKILSIGNSFSDDAQRYLRAIAASEGVEIETLNLCIGGLFEGTPKQMFEVLKKIKQLPNEVVFYPGHEYTQGGAAFAFRYNQGNKLIRDYLEYAKTRLDLGLPVSPISLEKEKQCNPYLQVNTFEEFENL